MLVAGSTRTAIAASDAFLVSAERAVEHAATATITLTVPSRTVRVFICASIGTMIEVLTTLAIREKKEIRKRRAWRLLRLAQHPAQRCVDEQIRRRSHVSPIDPFVVRFDQLQGDDAMRRRPEGLRQL